MKALTADRAGCGKLAFRFPLQKPASAGPFGRMDKTLLGALAQETIVPERQFLRTAFSDFPDSRKGGLRKASLPCIKSSRFRDATQLWPGSFG